MAIVLSRDGRPSGWSGFASELLSEYRMVQSPRIWVNFMRCTFELPLIRTLAVWPCRTVKLRVFAEACGSRTVLNSNPGLKRSDSDFSQSAEGTEPSVFVSS